MKTNLCTGTMDLGMVTGNKVDLGRKCTSSTTNTRLI